MDQKRYVQHISGQGEKWKVEDETVKTWRVESPRTELCNWDLPKSEYRLCDPPERWEDVTCYFSSADVTTASHIGGGYRLRKVELCDFKRTVFIVERKVQ